MNESERCRDGDDIREAGHYSPRCMLERGHLGPHVNGLFAWETDQFKQYVREGSHV